jgi:acid phosphatase type 7
LIQALYDNSADLVLSGHDHNYERFKPQDPNGTLDLVRGIRQFVPIAGQTFTDSGSQACH